MIAMYIPIHSFVDVITNSSSELFICATKSTIEMVKEIIDSFLMTMGSDKKSTDLFDFKLMVQVNNPNWKIDGLWSIEVDEDSNEGRKFIKNRQNDARGYNNFLKITPIEDQDLSQDDRELINTIANKLSNIIGTYAIDASMEG